MKRGEYGIRSENWLILIKKEPKSRAKRGQSNSELKQNQIRAKRDRGEVLIEYTKLRLGCSEIWVK